MTASTDPVAPAASTHDVELIVDGTPHRCRVETRDSLLDVVRGPCGATSVHAGCEQGACGACTVVLDGDLVRSCLVFAVQVDGAEVDTVASLAGDDGTLHPVQEAFARHHGLQCGYCTPAMVLAVVDLLATDPDPTEVQVRTALAGNLCRCTGYAGIVAAALDVAGATGTDRAPAGAVPPSEVAVGLTAAGAAP